MSNVLNQIFEWEEQGNFDQAFSAYKTLYEQNPKDYNIWRSFYFILWIAIEDAPSRFHEETGLRSMLQSMFDQGKMEFDKLSDFNFIAGYTVSIFPYEQGEYEDMSEVGIQMLNKATQLDPKNLIYRLVYWGFSNIMTTIGIDSQNQKLLLSFWKYFLGLDY